MKIYPLNKFYSLNILAYSPWVFHIALFFIAVYNFFIYPKFCTDSPFWCFYSEGANILYWYIIYFWFILTVLTAGILEIIFRKLGKIKGYNHIHGNKWIINLICWPSILSIPLSFYLIYKSVSLMDIIFFLND